ncbi:MAG: GAP family protein [Solirubrobacteraceae bacterium]
MRQVLLFSLTAMVNPTLVAATTVLLILPNPKRLMLGYLLGALMTSVTLGLVIVFALQDSSAVSSAKNTINPAVDFALGALLLVISFVLATGRYGRYKGRRGRHKPREEKKEPRWRGALSKGDPKITFAVGAVLTLPGASYLAALDHITKLKYNTLDTVLLVLLVNVIMLTLIEAPLLSYAIAPDWTPAAVDRAKASFSRHGHQIAVIGLAVIGSLLIIRGLITVLS